MPIRRLLPDPVLEIISLSMTVPITAEIHREGKWFVAFCSEFPEANGQGETRQECIDNLKASIELLLEDRREDARQKLPAGAELVEIN